MTEIHGDYDIHDPDVVSALDDLPLWSAPFGLKLLDTVKLRGNIRALDIGSGTGFPVVDLSQRLGATCEVFALDPWVAAVERIHAKVRTWGIQNLTIVEGTAEAIPFDDAHFDLITSNNGTNNTDDEEQAFREIARVAKPGAQVAFTVNLPDTMVEVYDAFRTVLGRREMTAELDRLEHHIHEKRKPLSHTLSLAEGVGLQINDVHEDAFAFRFTDAAAMFDHFTMKLAFIDGWKRALQPGDVESVFRDVSKVLDQQAMGDDALRLTIPWVCVDAVKPG